MKKLVIAAVVVVAAAAGIAYYAGAFNGQPAAQGAADPTGGRAGGDGRGGRRGGGGFGGGGQFRPPMTVEVASVTRTSIAGQITLVGNLIGDATVSVVPRTGGRLQEMSVRLGDRVNRGQRIAKIEDFEIVQQVKQAEAAQEVAQATIRQRDADLKLAETNVERSRNLFERQLLPKQTLDDNEARYQAAIAQLDLARAQNTQSKARLEELRINLANTIVTSPVNGFVARRAVDPGAFVSQNAPVADVVDITRVRLVANVVERDLKELQSGDPTRVEVDAFPGETFRGRIARVSPVLDPATRTAQIEIEIPNTDFRLKPGMYARVGIITSTKKDALVVPSDAVIDLGGRRGVFLPQSNQAVFRAVQIGTEEQDTVEILAGVQEGDKVITTGAAALRDGDRIVLPGGQRAGGGGRGGRTGGTAAQQGFGAPGTRQGGTPPNAEKPGSGATGTDGRSDQSGRFGGQRGRRSGGQGEGGRRFGGEGRRRGQQPNNEAAAPSPRS
jgi:HlyD family secretion protein